MYNTITTLEIPTIKCMSSATVYYGNTNKAYKDLIICKWELNGVEYFNSSSAANNSCKKTGYSELFSTGDGNSKIKYPEIKEIMRTYIVSSICTMNER